MDPPPKHVENHLQSAEFWTNKILLENRTVPHADWVKGLKDLLKGLVAYLKVHHFSGPAWNPTGITLSQFKPGAAGVAKTCFMHAIGTFCFHQPPCSEEWPKHLFLKSTSACMIQTCVLWGRKASAAGWRLQGCTTKKGGARATATNARRGPWQPYQGSSQKACCSRHCRHERTVLSAEQGKLMHKSMQ